jgi:isoquinoline 1-oxidoreductase beta subunit
LVLAQAPPLAEGQHRGTAVFKSFGSIVATVVDLSLHGSDLQIHRITTAVDCGIVVHPDTVHAQLMGATLMGLSAALHERVPFSEGASEVRNFDGYRILSMAETPTVDTHIVSSTESPGGVGEVALPPLAGALANAIFNASGFRLRTLPIGDQLDGLPSKAGD